MPDSVSTEAKSAGENSDLQKITGPNRTQVAAPKDDCGSPIREEKESSLRSPITASIAQMASEMDQDGDGQLTAVEIKKGFDAKGVPITLSQAEELVRKNDTDNSGRLSISELRKEGAFAAIATGDVANAMKMIYSAKFDCNGRDPENHNRTALHTAAEVGNTITVPMLMDKGCDEMLQDGEKNTPLELAIRNQHRDVAFFLCKKLLEKCAAEMKKRKMPQPKPIAVDGDNANLFNKVANGGPEVAIQVIYSGNFPINAANPKDMNKTLLHKAAESGNTTLVALLLENGADIMIVDDDHMTALDTAVCKLPSGKKDDARSQSHMETAYVLAKKTIQKYNDLIGSKSSVCVIC